MLWTELKKSISVYIIYFRSDKTYINYEKTFLRKKKKEMTIQCLVKDNKKSRGSAKLLYRTVQKNEDLTAFFCNFYWHKSKCKSFEKNINKKMIIPLWTVRGVPLLQGSPPQSRPRGWWLNWHGYSYKFKF